MKRVHETHYTTVVFSCGRHIGVFLSGIMSAVSETREEYIRFRLKEWGLWLTINHDETAHLKPKSLLGILFDRHRARHVSTPSDEECEEIHNIYLDLKAKHIKESDCLYAYYATGLGVSKCATKLGVSEDTFYQRKKAAERFVSGALR
jgi:hypothetical protein